MSNPPKSLTPEQAAEAIVNKFSNPREPWWHTVRGHIVEAIREAIQDTAARCAGIAGSKYGEFSGYPYDSGAGSCGYDRAACEIEKEISAEFGVEGREG